MTYQVPEQHGARAVVTGANSGTGWEAARQLAAAGADVIMAVRSPSRGERAKERILARHPTAVLRVCRLDLADLASVADFADGLVGDGQPLDLLLNNAGVMMLPERHETTDGHEMQFGTNVLGPFALTLRLLPALLAAERSRVVTMTSSNQAAIDFDNLDGRAGYHPIRAYARSKLAGLLFSQQLARIATQRRWRLLSLAAHPGSAATSIVDNGTQYGGQQPLLLRIAAKITPTHSAEAGAAPLLYAATAPDVRQGDYYGPRFGLVGPPSPARVSRLGSDEAVARQLWAQAERLTGVSLPAV